jgi:hypothetical protein
MQTAILLLLMIWGCSPQGSSSSEITTSQSDSLQIDKSELPKIGFNCKASYNIVEQTAFADALFSEMSENALENMVLRIPGGTRSQKDFARDWPDEKMKLWTDLQEKFGYTMVYVVNGNDSPENQLAIIRRWIANGAKFEFLEMMTEYYLPKFSKPKLDKPEVTKRVDAKVYTEEILPAYYTYLDSLELPYFLIFAPAKKTKMGTERYADWNDHMTKYVTSHKGTKEFGAVLHLYQKDYTKEYDYGQIDRLREELPEGMPLAVTELGVLDRALPLEEHSEESVRHISEVISHLQEGDYLMDQVLYHDYKNGNPMADTHPMYGGITPKGRAVVEYFNSLFE